MQVWLIVGYVACFFVLAFCPVMVLLEKCGVVAGVLGASGALVGLAVLRVTEEVVRRLPPRER